MFFLLVDVEVVFLFFSIIAIVVDGETRKQEGGKATLLEAAVKLVKLWHWERPKGWRMPSHYEHQQLQRKRKIRGESLKKQNKISAQLRCQQINDTI